MRYRWANCIQGFNMKVMVYLNGKENWLIPTTKWQNLNLETTIQSVEVDKDFYVASFQVTEIKTEAQSSPKYIIE